MKSAMKYLAFAGVVAVTLGASPSLATEIAPTPKMLASAMEMNKYKHPDEDISQSYEYHFRNLGGHILWCAHVSEGNGGFCNRLDAAYIASLDRSARAYCADGSFDHPVDDHAPHSVYGELYDLDYRCVKGRATRLPVGRALDDEGYVRSQWETLP